MQGRISGSLGALKSFGQQLRQSQEGAAPAKPSLADLARAKGKGGVEQGAKPVEIKQTGRPPRKPGELREGDPHPKDPTYVYDEASRQYKKRNPGKLK